MTQDWSYIGERLAYCSLIDRLAVDSQIGPGLVLDWQIGPGFALSWKIGAASAFCVLLQWP